MSPIAFPLLCLVWSASAPGAAVPDPRGVLTLERAVELAATHHPALRGAGWRARAAVARRADAGRPENPRLGLELENFGGSAETELREVTMTAEQTIELGGKGGARSRTAGALAELASAEQGVEERAVVREAAERFVEAWALQERSARLADAARLAEETIRAAGERHRAGAAPAVERTRAEAVHAQRESDRRRAEAELDTARRRLASSWGGRVAGYDSLALEPPRPIAVPPADSLARRLDRHPERRRAAAETAVAEARIREARAGRAPDLALAGGVRRIGDSEHGFVASASLPLPLWGRPRAAVAAAEAERAAASEDGRAVELRLEEELHAARALVLATGESHEALETRVLPKHEEALRQLLSGYRAGRFSSLEVLDAQRARLEAELARIDAAAEAWRARAALERLLGEPLEAAGVREAR